MKEREASWKSKYQGQTCIVFGNGPSLTMDQIAQARMSGHKIFVTNRFALALDNVELAPDFEFMSNYDAVKKFAHLYPEQTGSSVWHQSL